MSVFLYFLGDVSTVLSYPSQKPETFSDSSSYLTSTSNFQIF